MAKHKNLEQFEKQEQYQNRLHRVFMESEDGKELLKVWTDAVLMLPGNGEGDDLYSLGKVEGHKDFVRKLILFSKQAEAK